MTRFLVIGDAILDVTVAPSRPPRPGGDVPAVIRIGPGGQGANVAVRLARRGAAVTLAAPVAADAGGRLLREGLATEGVTLLALQAPRSSVVVALLDAGGERSMLSDRQVLEAAGLGDAIAATEWLHVSAYALLDDAHGDALADVIGERPRDVRLSVAGGSIPRAPSVAERFRARLATCRPDLLLLSRDEAGALLDGPPGVASETAEQLAGLAELVVVTAGAEGSAAALAGSMHRQPAAGAAGPVLDTTGSGDAYLAALIIDVADGPWPPTAEALDRAMAAGSLAGALAVRVLGAQGRIPGETGEAP